ncbi:MAG: spermine/spermidine synthase domain-containing protein [bacterium]
MQVNKYGGTLLHTVRDEYGLVEVVERGEKRILYFETPVEQSCIVLHEPLRLMFDYYRPMLLPLLFQPSPGKVLLLGLGGGVLARFLVETLPETEVVAVEFRESVVDIAYSHFGLPDTPRLSVWVTEASWFLGHTEERFDLIMVDVYDALGLSEHAAQVAFFDSAMLCLEEGGMLAMNLWTSDKESFSEVSAMLQRVFEDRVFYVDVNEGNRVALAFSAGEPSQSMKQLKREASAWRDRAGIDFVPDLKRLKQWSGAGYGPGTSTAQ